MDLCQAVHEGMLLKADCLRPSETLRYRLPTPKGDTFEGAYADYHVVVQRLTVEELKQAAHLRDTDIVNDSVVSYESFGAEMYLKKREDTGRTSPPGAPRAVAGVVLSIVIWRKDARRS